MERIGPCEIVEELGGGGMAKDPRQRFESCREMAAVQRDTAASLEKLSSIDAVERALREVSGVLASTREVLSEFNGPLAYRLAPSRPSAPGPGAGS